MRRRQPAVATIETIRDEKLLENAQERGSQLMGGLKELQEQFPVIGDVRGLGLMVATEMRTIDRELDKATAKAVLRACFARRLLLLTADPWDNTIRWIPPLNGSHGQIDEALRLFEEALWEVAGGAHTDKGTSRSPSRGADQDV